MSGPTIPVELRGQVATDAKFRCGYCLTAELISGQQLEIEHWLPTSRGGRTVRENLWLACRDCNVRKTNRMTCEDPETGMLAPLFNPRVDAWSIHFAWNSTGDLIVGQTPCGRGTIAALHLNRTTLVRARQKWVEAGWHPPRD